ncbi:hypothetical protein HPB52_022664 [Rhipicephalus sanguineus]|uniref:Nose resistant-to-fluoxetine protein N-terminal domain-containing protein n=1 Tax=Rhipicephalus sanguineus TaxID=34632 RepID=A0A9D4PZ02_RHISA|nr:hypothetical protein HPB52_022664 [Rhipicephalus sanguineus]
MRLQLVLVCVLLRFTVQCVRAQQDGTNVTEKEGGSENAGDELDYLPLLRNALAGGFANMPVALRRKLLSADVTPECNAGLLRTMRAFQNLEPWALRLLDASGKFPTGLLQGSRVDLGAFDECLETEVFDSYGDVITRGQYCNLLVYIENSTAVEGKIDSFSSVLHPKLKYFKNYFSVEELPVVRIAMCFVEECTQRDLQALVDAVKPRLVRLEVSNCVTAQVEPWIFMLCCFFMACRMFLCILLVIILAATFTDRVMKLKPKLIEKHGALSELTKGFSVTSNTRMLLRVADKSNTEHYSLQFLHGMRFFCIVHIVLCHSGQTLSDNWSRYLNLLIASDEWSFMIFSAGFSSVGTFFFLSGFFLSLTVRRQTRSGPVVFIIGVIRRFIRTAIPLFFIIMCLHLMPRFVFGPDTKSFFHKLHEDVAHHWWHLLLMIRNFVEITAWDVLPHVWYLSTDFQLFTISLVVLLAFKSRKMLAVGAFLLLSLLGCAIGTWAVAGSDLLPFMIFPGPILQVMSKTVNEYYMRPYYHAVCYFGGCIAYLLIEDFRQRKINKFTLLFAFIVWCYLLAYLAFLACEAPTGALDKFIFTRLIGGGGNARKQEHRTQQNGGDVKPQIKIDDSVFSRC